MGVLVGSVPGVDGDPAVPAHTCVPGAIGATGVHAEHVNTGRAACAAAVRFSTISLAKTLSRCFATVRTLEARMMAISALLLPWLTQSNTSASRLVKPSFCKGTASRT